MVLSNYSEDAPVRAYEVRHMTPSQWRGTRAASDVATTESSKSRVLRAIRVPSGPHSSHSFDFGLGNSTTILPNTRTSRSL